MKGKSDVKIKKIIIAIVLIGIVLTIKILINKQNNENMSENNIDNIIEFSKENDFNDDSSNIIDNVDTKNDLNTDKNIKQSLIKINSLYNYFLMQECLKTYYLSNNMEFIQGLLDPQAKKELDIDVFNTVENNGNEIYTIDDIYGQYLDENLKIYVVYYRVSSDLSTYKNTEVIIKIDEKNECFSIFPYEYIKLHNYENLTEGDQIEIDNLDYINKNKNNTISLKKDSIDARKCAKELFDKFRFDLLVDIDHLYISLDEQYKSLRFSNKEKLIQYVNDNKENLYYDSVNDYTASNEDDFEQFIIKTGNNKQYVFRVGDNLMNYKLFLDNYEIVASEDIYNESFSNDKAKYCISIVMKAINDNNYSFVYEKLNPVQKNNYYKTEEEFRKFLSSSFYKESNYELEEDYLIISSNVYQFNVKVTDATGNDFSYVNLTISVTLKEGTDFEVAIVNRK